MYRKIDSCDIFGTKKKKKSYLVFLQDEFSLLLPPAASESCQNQFWFYGLRGQTPTWVSVLLFSNSAWTFLVGQGQACKDGQPLAGRPVERRGFSSAGTSAAAAVAVLQGVLRGETLQRGGLNEGPLTSRAGEHHAGVLLVAAVFCAGKGIAAIEGWEVTSMAADAAGMLGLYYQRNVVDVSGAGSGLRATELECCCCLALQGLAGHRGEQVGRRRGDGGSAAEAQVRVVEGRRQRRGRRGPPRRAEEPGKADALAELVAWILSAGGRGAGLRRLKLVLELSRRQRAAADFLLVDEVAAGAVGAVAEVVEGSAGLRLVFGVAVQAAQLRLAVGKLAFAAVLAAAALLVPAAEFSLVAVGGKKRLGLDLEGGGRGEARRRRHGGVARGEALQAFELAQGREEAAAGLGQAHGAVGPEGGLRLGQGGLAPYVVGPERAAVIEAVEVLAAQADTRGGRGGRGEEGDRSVEPSGPRDFKLGLG